MSDSAIVVCAIFWGILALEHYDAMRQIKNISDRLDSYYRHYRGAKSQYTSLEYHFDRACKNQKELINLINKHRDSLTKQELAEFEAYIQEYEVVKDRI